MHRAQPRYDGLDQVSYCPICNAARHGEHLIKHCRAKHQRQVPFVITVAQPAELIRASNLLRARLRGDLLPPGSEIG
jgi:hypothetical protein